MSQGEREVALGILSLIMTVGPMMVLVLLAHRISDWRKQRRRTKAIYSKDDAERDS